MKRLLLLAAAILAAALCTAAPASAATGAGPAPPRPALSAPAGTPVPPSAGPRTLVLPAGAVACTTTPQAPVNALGVLIGFGYTDCQSFAGIDCETQAYIQEWLPGRDGDWTWYTSATGEPNFSCEGSPGLYGENSLAAYHYTSSNAAYYFRTAVYASVLGNDGGQSGWVYSAPVLFYVK
jgi:hypothetical protein